MEKDLVSTPSERTESVKVKGRNRKELFLQHIESITAKKMQFDRIRSEYQLLFKNAQTDGFTLLVLKRAMNDRKLDSDTRDANYKEEVLYRKWLEEF